MMSGLHLMFELHFMYGSLRLTFLRDRHLLGLISPFLHNPTLFTAVTALVYEVASTQQSLPKIADFSSYNTDTIGDDENGD